MREIVGVPARRAAGCGSSGERRRRCSARSSGSSPRPDRRRADRPASRPASRAADACAAWSSGWRRCEPRAARAAARTTILDEVERAVVGKREALELVLLGILADGHVLIEDFPGLAKTLIARAFAQVTSIGFTRIQFTPDLMPSDVTGSSIYNQREADFEFRPGPIFTNLLLADEINRAPPKTQAALLEAMQERQVTIEGDDAPARRRRSSCSRPRTRSSTRAPTRCPRRSSTASCCGSASATPSASTSGTCSRAGSSARTDEVELEPVVGRDELLEMQQAIEQVHVARSVGLYMVDLVAATRDAPAASRSARARAARSRC